jgi:hypothetical protein
LACTDPGAAVGNAGRLPTDAAFFRRSLHCYIIGRTHVLRSAHIKAYGTYQYDVKLFPEVVGKLTVTVCDK